MLKKLWTEDSVTYQGEFFQVARYTLGTKPMQSPHPPIWIGGHSKAAVNRTARLADGFIGVSASAETCRTNFDSMDAQAHKLGRGPLTRAVHTFLCFAQNRDSAAEIGTTTLSQRFGRSFAISDPKAHLLGTGAECRETLGTGRAIR